MYQVKIKALAEAQGFIGKVFPLFYPYLVDSQIVEEYTRVLRI